MNLLIGPDTVYTLPSTALDAFLDHGKVAETLATNIKGARVLLKQLQSLGISLELITEKLQKDGVSSFTKSFKSLLDSIEIKRVKWHPK